MSEQAHWAEVRARVKDFVESKVYPLEKGFDRDSEDCKAALTSIVTMFLKPILL